MNKDYCSAILATFVLTFFIAVYYGGDKIPDSWLTGVSYYDQNNLMGCHVVVTEPSIILRIDDVQNGNEPLTAMIQDIRLRGLSVTLGVVPALIGTGTAFDDYLFSVARSSDVEIAVHGYDHALAEINISESYLQLGFDKVVSKLGVVPVTYIPPFNSLTPEAYDKVAARYRVVSMTGGKFRSGVIAEVGQDVETFDYEGVYASRNSTSDVNTIISRCSAALSLKNLCVVTFHPQELSSNMTNPIDVDASKFLSYQVVLSRLELLNASFVTFSDVVRCSN